MWSVRGGITVLQYLHSSRSSLQGHLLWNQSLLCSQRKWRDDKLGSYTRLMPWIWCPWQHQCFTDALPAECKAETTGAKWKFKPDEGYFHWEFVFSPWAHSETMWSTCAVLAITAFWEDLYASNTGFIGEHWPGVAGWCPGSQNPLISGVRVRTFFHVQNKEQIQFSQSGSSNSLQQMHAILQEKCWGSPSVF